MASATGGLTSTDPIEAIKRYPGAGGMETWSNGKPIAGRDVGAPAQPIPADLDLAKTA